MKLKSCCLLSASLGVALLCDWAGSAALAQQNYPTRPVRLVVPSSPGGGTDISARIIAPKLTEQLGQQVVVENRPGAGTMIGGEVVARAAPDGYTLLMGISTLAINPAIYRKVPYDALRDFAPISQVVSLPNILVTHPSLPVKTVKELIAFARTRPGQLNFASAGLGTNPHLSMELFLSMTRLKMVHVPYKGSGPGVVDLMAGHVPIMTPSIITALSYVKNGRLRALGVTSGKRTAGAPDIPTIAEAGVPGYEAVQWFGVLAPAGTPRDIVGKMHATVVRVLQDSDTRKRFINDGADPVGSSPEQFAAFIRAETVKWAKVVREAGLKSE
ncbi:MAG: tripartite tricarboxylate transporter substrate binding protein [Betaproteobacteria bacterium]|nr:tripartite tricarboxylate transporter substrate binding protein [Betaproteobacteria bacterium]